MGGKDRRVYANWANHTSNLSKINAGIRRVGSLTKLSELPRASCVEMIREAQFSDLEVLTGLSCPLHARGPALSARKGSSLLAAMALEPPLSARYWALAVADLDIPAARVVLSAASLLVTYPKAAAPPVSYRELLEGLLRDIGAPILTPGDRPRDFLDDLD